MHVTVLSPWYPNPDAPLEGVFVQRQIGMLRERELTLHVFHPQVELGQLRHRWIPRTRIHPDREHPSVQVFHLQGPFPPKAGARLLEGWAGYCAGFFPRYIQKLGRPDLVHAHTLLGGLIARVLQDRHSIPYVTTLHESAILRQEVAPWRRRVFQPMLAESADVWAVSRALAQSAATLFGFRDIGCLPNFIDTDIFQPARVAVPGRPFRFVAIGDLIPVKAFSLLIKAFQALTTRRSVPMELHLIGDGPLAGALRRQRRELALADRVHFHGSLDRREVARVLAGADALVLSSHLETFGIVLVEAMACGLPVVATRCGGPEDIVTPDTGLLVEPGSVSALTEGMTRIMDRHQAFDAALIRRHAVERFGAGAVAPRLIERYRAAM